MNNANPASTREVIFFQNPTDSHSEFNLESQALSLILDASLKPMGSKPLPEVITGRFDTTFASNEAILNLPETLKAIGSAIGAQALRIARGMVSDDFVLSACPSDAMDIGSGCTRELEITVAPMSTGKLMSPGTFFGIYGNEEPHDTNRALAFSEILQAAINITGASYIEEIRVTLPVVPIG